MTELPKRVVVVGASGSGKSTFARRLAPILGARRIELDAIYHQPNWQPLPEDQMRERVKRLVSGDRWVVDGNYRMVADIAWAAADTVVWLDYPRYLVLARLLRRTIPRQLLRTPLWNGNREPFLGFLDPRPDKNVILYSMLVFRERKRTYVAAKADPAWGHLNFVHLRTPKAADSWLSCAALRR